MILTIGHSNHSKARFLDLLYEAKVTTLIDVRSYPRSRFAHFNEGRLTATVEEAGIAYLFFGNELGGSQASADVSYEDVANFPTFKQGIQWVLEVAQDDRAALMCSEYEPLECHRGLLIGRYLHERGTPVGHILRSGQIEPHSVYEDRLLAKTGLGANLFATRALTLDAAYRMQALRLGVGQ